MAGINAHVSTKTCRRMFPAASLVTTRDRRQQRRPLRGHVVHTCREPWALEQATQVGRGKQRLAPSKHSGVGRCAAIKKNEAWLCADQSRRQTVKWQSQPGRGCAVPHSYTEPPAPPLGLQKGPRGRGVSGADVWALEDANLSPSSHVLHEMLTTCK